RRAGVGPVRGRERAGLAARAAEIRGLGGDATEVQAGLAIRPRPLHGGVFASHDDHRLVMAAAVLGLAVPRVEVENPATVGQTFPEVTKAWLAMLESAARPARPARPAASGLRRTMSGCAGGAAPGPVPGAGPRTRARSRDSWPPSSGAGTAS